MEEVFTTLGFILGGIATYYFYKFILGKNIKEHHSNWNTLIDNFEFGTTEFYSRLETELESHGVTNMKIRNKTFKEGLKVFSSSRLYLQVTWKNYEYNICCAKFGNGLFFSWWLLYKSVILKRIILQIPFAGEWIANRFYPITFYRIDTASMFMSYAQNSVLKVIEDITKEKGGRTLSEEERKPILNNVFKR